MKRKIEDIQHTENGIKLKDTTKFFTLKEKEQSEKYAKSKRSYVGHCFNQFGKFIGFYVPE